MPTHIATMEQWDPLTEAVVATTEDQIQANVDEEQQSMPQIPFPAVSATASQHQHQQQLPPPQTKTQTGIQQQPTDFQLSRAKFEKWVRQQLISFYTK